MIFVTVGAQMPFDRLVRAVDDWAGDHPEVEVFAQIGPSRFRPSHCRHERFLRPEGFRDVFQQAALIVAHAGMGSIITALEYGKPILVMPRRGDLAETRNDHQLATAKQFGDLGVVEVGLTGAEIRSQLDRLTRHERCASAKPSHCRLSNDGCQFKNAESCRSQARGMPCPGFIAGIRAFVQGQPLAEVMRDRRRPFPRDLFPADDRRPQSVIAEHSVSESA